MVILDTYPEYCEAQFEQDTEAFLVAMQSAAVQAGKDQLTNYFLNKSPERYADLMGEMYLLGQTISEYSVKITSLKSITMRMRTIRWWTPVTMIARADGVTTAVPSFVLLVVRMTPSLLLFLV